jgi:hypothetical protein
MLHSLITEHLTADDDTGLWQIATTTLFALAEASAAKTRKNVFVQIGSCSHWISPHHPIRWIADGGFAWPFGYDKTTTGFSYRALPELSWSELLKWTGEDWEPDRLGKRSLVFRVAIPARTARHLQAAIHTVWTPRSPTEREKMVQLFGFRKKHGKWLLTASDKLPPRKCPSRTRR